MIGKKHILLFDYKANNFLGHDEQWIRNGLTFVNYIERYLFYDDMEEEYIPKIASRYGELTYEGENWDPIFGQFINLSCIFKNIELIQGKLYADIDFLNTPRGIDLKNRFEQAIPDVTILYRRENDRGEGSGYRFILPKII